MRRSTSLRARLAAVALLVAAVPTGTAALALATPAPAPAQGSGDGYFARWGGNGRTSRYAEAHRRSLDAANNRANHARRPKAGLHTSSLPPDAVEQQIGTRTYYYAQGSWYTPVSGGGYTVVRRPKGADVPRPPQDCELVYGGRKPYCYLDGVFYKVDPTGFTPTDPEVGVVVPYLPRRAKKVTDDDGKQSMLVDGHRFRPVIYSGKVAYQVVEVARAPR